MKEEKIIEKGRENDSLTVFGKEVYDMINAYQKAHPEFSCLVLMTDKKGGTDFLMGEPKDLAKDFLEAATTHASFFEVVKNVLKTLRNA